MARAAQYLLLLGRTAATLYYPLENYFLAVGVFLTLRS
jgi:hypothetical protein